MKRSDFSYELPKSLIAQRPCEQRTGARLLVLDGADGTHRDLQFCDLPSLLRPNDLLVLNDTQVLPARSFAFTSRGARIELMAERIVSEHRMLAQIRPRKSVELGQYLMLDGQVSAKVVAEEQSMFLVDVAMPVLMYLQNQGHVPLPPYVKREDEPADRQRYQTVYAKVPGAVAAPTAGLHFDEPMLAQLQQMGVQSTTVTLHVGAGTFQPVRVEDITEHQMHSEVAHLGQETVDAIARARASGGRVIAVGTTAVRTLESAAGQTPDGSGELAPFEGETSLFIYPGYRFSVVDAMVTNFHVPESTLLMLVSAFAGREQVLASYRHAVSEQYRFFSYGDAMFITPQGAPGAI